jgi:hypothetical protein
MPARGLVLGDMLLAQKIALETMEQEALASRIASRVLMRAGSRLEQLALSPHDLGEDDASHVACDCRFYPKGLLMGQEHVDP